MNTLTLDRLDGLAIERSTFPIKNLHALLYLPDGIHAMARLVRLKELEVLKNAGADLVLWMPPAQESSMITNWFGWFSVSLISYLRLVRLLPLMAEKGWTTSDLRLHRHRSLIKSECAEYIKKVVPAVYHWRNKIGAHTAFSDPFEHDSLGTLEASLITPVVYTSPYFIAGGYNWGTEGEVSDFKPWSASAIFQELGPRLWPERRIDPLSSEVK